MNEEQRAVVLARTHDDLKFDAMSTSMRSCFPDYVVAKRRAVGAHVVEPRAAMDETAEIFQAEPGVEFDDVELFLAEHGGLDSAAEPEDTYEEHEIADILAVLQGETTRIIRIEQVETVSPLPQGGWPEEDLSDRG